jgi:hypothetical protein
MEFIMKKNVLLILAITSLTPVLLNSTQNFNQLLMNWIIAHNSKSSQSNKYTQQLKEYINKNGSKVPSTLLSTVIQNGDYSLIQFCLEKTTNKAFKVGAKEWVQTNHTSLLGLVNPTGQSPLSANQKKIINFLNQYIIAQ